MVEKAETCCRIRIINLWSTNLCSLLVAGFDSKKVKFSRYRPAQALGDPEG
jgi:hypothetical protein